MKPNYKNWVPTGMVFGYAAGASAFLALTIVFAVLGFVNRWTWAIALFAVCAVICVILCVITAYMAMWHNAFSYTGRRQLSKYIVEGTAAYVSLPEGGKCLDVGCGSGALTIAVAKRNPQADVVGVDRWGKDYASFSKPLCEHNAQAEGVTNTSFARGNACELPFADETFDAVTSNYVYHNIPSKDRQSILLETLRVLKKGGTFAIHDLFTVQKYGDMAAFIAKLKTMGYKKVELIDTTNGKFMTKKEAKRLFLDGSKLLVGKK